MGDLTSCGQNLSQQMGFSCGQLLKAQEISQKNKHEEILFKHGVSSDHPLGKDLLFDKSERPIVAQFFSRDPERMKRAAALAHELGYDGVDINMGCPADVICKQGAGSAMIKRPLL